MPLLNYVLIQPELGLWSKETNAVIRDQSRVLGIYLGHGLKKLKIRPDDFSGLFFMGLPESDQPIEISQNKLLCIPISFSEKEYLADTSEAGISEFLMARVREGLLRLQQDYAYLCQPIENLLDEFASIHHYKYHWVHKKRVRIPNTKKKVFLNCYIDIHEFRLVLDITEQGESLFSNVILSTPPNEYSFKHRFRDLKVIDTKVYITNFLNYVCYTFDLDTMTAEHDELLTYTRQELPK